MRDQIRCVLAESIHQLDDALSVRWRVFADEMGLLSRRPPVVAREVHGYDTLDTTLHFIAYDGKVPVGTVRMLLPNSQLAEDNGLRLGLDLERKVDLGGLAYASVGLAELSRVCILRPWRRSNALASLCRAMYVESRRRNLTHWIGSANCDTDSLEDARIAYLLLQRRGLVSDLWRALPLPMEAVPPPPRKPLYSPQARLKAMAGQLTGLRIPPLVAQYALMLGARYLGEPIYDTHFNMCSIPLIAALADLPAATLSARPVRREQRPASTTDALELQ